MVKFYCSLSLVQWMSGKSILSQGSALSPYPNTGARWKFCASWSPYGFLYVHGDACCSLLIVLFHTWDSWCGVSLCWELSLVSMLHSLEVHPPKNWLSRNWKALKEDSIVLSPVCVISSHKSLASRILLWSLLLVRARRDTTNGCVSWIVLEDPEHHKSWILFYD